ncbi:pyridoxine kinase [Schistosoma mansoni]|uniref:Pyridoxal kinase n=1 Tax=Schistosoma mansoni TaxID=6183 RepID=A0A7S9VN83_SCHMA|nr:pyridoxine kinase [Schistosoma mansoni]QPI70662.1 pyridoxal kinase isoform 1 [Schistosoma mansoni]|eukprot:XP_018646270.1 pyridoxine kinase [Schistosoma mansoni]
MAVKVALNCLKVLCIQSHVVHGYVGNKIAVFPLQVCVLLIITYTGYDFVKGQVLDAASMKDLYLGLKANGLNKYTHVLTGYLASPSSLEAVADIVSDLKKENSNLKYYCDPVLGDNGKLYVPPELVQIYQERILPLSDVIFPNQFEAEILSGIPITDEKSALNCINYLHKKYHIPTVIITSTNITCSPVMYGYGSRLNSLMKNNNSSSGSDLLNQTNGSVTNNTSEYDRVRFKIPHFNYHFIGTGDLFAALTLAHLETRIENENGQQIAKYSFKDAFQSVLSTIQTVLSKTLKISEGESLLNMSKSARIELKIIQCLDDIRNPVLGDYVEEM